MGIHQQGAPIMYVTYFDHAYQKGDQYFTGKIEVANTESATIIQAYCNQQLQCPKYVHSMVIINETSNSLTVHTPNDLVSELISFEW